MRVAANSSPTGCRRIERVVGVAGRDPLVPGDPTSPRNRRISIVLLREAKEAPPPRAAQR